MKTNSTRSIKQKLLVSFLLVGLLPVLAISIASIKQITNALEHEAESNLEGIRNIRAREVESYFGTIRKQAITMAHDPATIDALTQFKAAYAQLEQTAASQPMDKIRAGVSGYVENDFSEQFKKLNPGNVPTKTTQLVANLSDASAILQNRYISSNPNPLGSKDKLMSANDGSEWTKVHEKYHPVFRSFLQQFGYYDIFLVDIDSGTVVYTVFKELDFATSLKNGSYADTGLGQAFQAARSKPYTEPTISSVYDGMDIGY